MFSLKKEEFKFPIEYDANCHFYEDYLLMDNQDYPYDKIFSIYYTNKSEYTNGVRISHKILFLLAFSLKDYIPIPMYENDIAGTAEFVFDRGLIPTNKRMGKVLEFMYEYISKKTLEQRLKFHLNTLAMYGKFSLMSDLPVFYNKGDVEINGVFVGNLKKMYDAGKIIDGEKFGGYKDKTSNPYIYGFEKGTKFFGLVSDKVLFKNAFNRDIMYILFNNLYKTGKMVELDEIIK